MVGVNPTYSKLLLHKGHLNIFKFCAGRKPLVNDKRFIFSTNLFYIKRLKTKITVIYVKNEYRN